MRLVYLGSPEIAVGPLRALVGAGHDVALVVTQPDKRRGRGGGLVPTPVKRAAEELGLPVTDRIDDVLELDPPADLGVVVAFGRLIKPDILDRLPMVNLHFSRLPRWRGAAPVERAILAGDATTAVAVMAVETGLDTGGIHAEAEVDIGPDETADELRARLAQLGTELLLTVLDGDLGIRRVQDGETTYARKLDPAELEIDWSRPAEELHRLVRVGPAWTTFRGHRLKVLRTSPAPDRGLAPGAFDTDGVAVGTGRGTLVLAEVQPEGRSRLAAEAWARGARVGPGDRLGS